MTQKLYRLGISAMLCCCIFIDAKSTLAQAPLVDKHRSIEKKDRVFGEQQVILMLNKLPQMRSMVEKDDFLWNWAVDQFAGKAADQRIAWSDSATSSPEFISEHSIPRSGQPGSIFMNELDERGQRVSSEKLWYYFTFECFNIGNHEAFLQIYKDAIDGRLNQEEYIRRYTELEYKALLKTFDFYKFHVEPYARKKGISTDCVMWGSQVPNDYKTWISQYSDRNKYPWSSYAKYYNEVIVPYRKEVDTYNKRKTTAPRSEQIRRPIVEVQSNLQMEKYYPMKNKSFIVNRENQFSSKKAIRTAAAMAPIEQKLEKLVQLQKLSSELAQQTGRKGKTPWPVRSTSP